VDDAVGTDDVVGAEDLGGVNSHLTGGLGGQMQVVVVSERGVAAVGGGPVARGDSRGENVGHEERLKGAEIAGLKEEALELGVEVAFEGLVSRREDGDVVVADGIFKLLEKKCFVDELG